MALKIGRTFHKTFTVLIDSGVDLNCIREGLIPTQYSEKTLQKLFTTNNSNLKVQFKLSNANICNKGKYYNNNFILTKDISKEIILGTPFLTQIYPFMVSEVGIKTKNNLFEFITSIIQKEIKSVRKLEEDNFLSLIKNKENRIPFIKREITYLKVEEELIKYQHKFKELEKEFINEVCSEIPTAFWERHSFSVELPYEEGFHESKIQTKAKLVQMNKETLEYCKKDINKLLEKN